jgi:hypothetical protein
VCGPSTFEQSDRPIGRSAPSAMANPPPTRPPLDMAYADGRLFVIDAPAASVRIFDVAMDPTAAVAPITKPDAPLITLLPIRMISYPILSNALYGITASAATAACGARVFVGNTDSATIAEMTRDGVCVRTFDVAGGGVTGPLRSGSAMAERACSQPIAMRQPSTPWL